MTRLSLAVLFFLQILFSQSFTGGIKLSTSYTQYSNNSIVLGDSIKDNNYTVSNEIPGFKQLLSFNGFGTMASGNTAIVLEIANDPWTSISDFPDQEISRFTLDWNRENFYVTLGDFYKNEMDLFISSRPIRGLKLSGLFGIPANKWKVDLYGGEFEKAINYDNPLKGQYKVYENGGVFRRIGGAMEISKKWSGFLNTKIEALWAKDQENSISQSTVKPLENLTIGSTVSSFLFDSKLNVGIGYWVSNLDSLKYQTIQEASVQGQTFNPDSKLDSLKSTSGSDNAFKIWANYKDKYAKVDFEFYRVGSSYYTAGNPYLLNDRLGAKLNTFYSFTGWFGSGIQMEYYYNNLNKSDQYPRSKTLLFNPKLSFKYSGWLFSINFPYQSETSDTLFQVLIPTVINRSTSGPELELSVSIGAFSASYSAYFTKVNDNSLIFGDSLFDNTQNIHNLNLFYTDDRLLLSLGASASSFDGGGHTSGFINIGFYGNLRYQIIPLSLVGEASFTAQENKVDYINIWEKIGSYSGQTGSISLEYFFNPSFSIKAQFDFVNRKYDYSRDDVREILNTEGFDYTYFNGQENLFLIRPSIELNLLF